MVGEGLVEDAEAVIGGEGGDWTKDIAGEAEDGAGGQNQTVGLELPLI